MNPRNSENDDSDLDEKRLTLLEHLEELRVRIIKSLVAVLLGTAISFIFSARLVDFLIKPCISVIKMTYYTSILQPFNVRFKASIYAGIILTSPFILYQLWKFVSPALTKKEKRVLSGLFGFAIFFFLGGVAAAYFYFIPVGTEILIQYQTSLMKPLIGIEEVIGFVGFFMLGMGIVFELPLVMLGLAKVGIITSRTLRKNWRIVYLGVFFVGFAITPGNEIMTSFILSVVLLMLYEISILLIKLVEKKKRDSEIEYEMDKDSDESSL